MTPLARMPLEGGGFVLVEAPATTEGPVKAGRIGDAIHDLPETLQEALGPVTEAARVALDQLREARPDDITIQFGHLSVAAGAAITKTPAPAEAVAEAVKRVCRTVDRALTAEERSTYLPDRSVGPVCPAD